jgi:hypothetical protein
MCFALRVTTSRIQMHALVTVFNTPLYARERHAWPLYSRLGGPQLRTGRVRKISPSTGTRSLDHNTYLNWETAQQLNLSLRSVYPTCTSKEGLEPPNILWFQCSIGHITWAPTYVFCCWRHKFAIEALLCNNQYFCIVDSEVLINDTQWMYCCVSTATVVMRIRQNVTLHVPSLSYFVKGHEEDLLGFVEMCCLNCFWYSKSKCSKEVVLTVEMCLLKF